MSAASIVRRFGLPLLIAVVVVGAIVVAARPAPVPVDAETVGRGAIVTSVLEDGRTRVQERYTVSSPLAGRLERIMLEAGDAIAAGETILARIDPADPALLDARAVAEAEARVSAAEAAVARAASERLGAQSALDHAENELADLEAAGRRGAATERELDAARLAATLRLQELRAAEFSGQIATFELAQARAALVRTDDGRAGAPGWRFDIPAPITGRVLRVLRDSAGVVVPGEALLEVGDTDALEVEVDVLSTDAVRVAPGAAVSIERWGGATPLRGRVRIVEPSGFTKISALGVEEQRVNVIVDFLDPASSRPGLGDGFRVDARIILDERPDVVRAPVGAVFRDGDGWAAFRLVDGRAARVPVEIGARNDEAVEIRGGLEPGMRVIVYPSDRVRDGVRVAVRGESGS